MKRTILLCLVAASTGCTSVSTLPRPDTYGDTRERFVEFDDSTEPSLFSSDSEVLSDGDISRILDYELRLPPTVRIAMLREGHGHRAWWQDSAQLGDRSAAAFAVRLRESGRVYDASFIPRMLLPPERNAGHLRQAAARYQADLLLVYRATCESYTRHRVFNPNEVRAYCGVEAILLDIRTGIVPFSSLATRDYTAQKNKEDFEFQETVRRTQMETIEAALLEVADDVTRFLDSVSRTAQLN